MSIMRKSILQVEGYPKMVGARGRNGGLVYGDFEKRTVGITRPAELREGTKREPGRSGRRGRGERCGGTVLRGGNA